LLENVFHASHVIKELEAFDYHGFTEGYLLSSPLLASLKSFRAFISGNFTPDDSMHLVHTVLDTLHMRDLLSQNSSSSQDDSSLLRTCVRQLRDGEVIEWDCLHEGGGQPEAKEATDESERAEEDDDQSMEDLTEEVKDHDGTQSVEMDGSADEDEDHSENEGDEKGEKAETNSCISIYY
jgi:hypothetical protein